MVLPGEVYPVRNSSRCDSKPSGPLNLAGFIIKPDSATQQGGIISNGVNIISYCALGSGYLGGQSRDLFHTLVPQLFLQRLGHIHSQRTLTEVSIPES